MYRYQLFSARDGDVLDTVVLAPDEEVARLIAANCMANEFDLGENERRDFDEAAAATDGAVLYQVTSPEYALAIEGWALGQLSFLKSFKGLVDVTLEEQLREAQSAILKLALSAQTQS